MFLLFLHNEYIYYTESRETDANASGGDVLSLVLKKAISLNKKNVSTVLPRALRKKNGDRTGMETTPEVLRPSSQSRSAAAGTTAGVIMKRRIQPPPPPGQRRALLATFEAVRFLVAEGD